jgi:hypothetical protein
MFKFSKIKTYTQEEIVNLLISKEQNCKTIEDIYYLQYDLVLKSIESLSLIGLNILEDKFKKFSKSSNLFNDKNFSKKFYSYKKIQFENEVTFATQKILEEEEKSEKSKQEKQELNSRIEFLVNANNILLDNIERLQSGKIRLFNENYLNMEVNEVYIGHYETGLFILLFLYINYAIFEEPEFLLEFRLKAYKVINKQDYSFKDRIHELELFEYVNDYIFSNLDKINPLDLYADNLIKAYSTSFINNFNDDIFSTQVKNDELVEMIRKLCIIDSVKLLEIIVEKIDKMFNN